MGNASLFLCFVTINLAIEMEMKWGKINLNRAHLLKTNDEHTKNTRETITVFMTSSSLISVTAKRKNKSIYQEGKNKITF